jgi:hypothetical protein
MPDVALLDRPRWSRHCESISALVRPRSIFTPPSHTLLLSAPGSGTMTVNIYDQQAKTFSSMNLPLGEDLSRRKEWLDVLTLLPHLLVPVVKLVQPPSNLANG